MHRIFIVEDDAAIAAALQKHLTTWGFDVRCAEDFRNVLAECTAFDPQLVLLDIALPFYNGYHWCQELRRVSNVPVVFISSASDNMNIVMAMNMGGDDFIAKPFDLNVLLFVIEQVLSNALKYTRSGSVSITLEAPKTLCIRDTGIGIAPEDLPRVFEKGFTGCNGRTGKRATGIGLYLCRRILEKLGHTIAITSTVGEGTTVRIGLQQDALEVE